MRENIMELWEHIKLRKRMHSKHYYKKDRNIDYAKEITPDYYIGEVFKYKVKDIIRDFRLSYNLATAFSYIARSSKKHKSPKECIQKAINHLKFELEEYE